MMVRPPEALGWAAAGLERQAQITTALIAVAPTSATATTSAMLTAAPGVHARPTAPTAVPTATMASTVRGIRQPALRLFTPLSSLPATLSGSGCMRIVTSWPSSHSLDFTYDVDRQRRRGMFH
ncbi:hypothetical protein J5X84_26710 [Streptosporangiaceae bacterium NEAU-GS5]|nr:hypothetical protein [Streptosporangiaceae bacterium NEAU-GS5]